MRVLLIGSSIKLAPADKRAWLQRRNARCDDDWRELMEKPEIDIQYEDWHAVHDHMGKALRVYGQCTVRGGGFAVGLEPHDKQGVNPRMLILSVRITPTGESPSHQAPKYEQPWDDNGIQYNEVDFEVVGPVTAAAPTRLSVADVY
jgi:hypothetical protein